MVLLPLAAVEAAKPRKRRDMYCGDDNCYDVLISVATRAREIRAKYKKLVLRWHPDKNPAAEAKGKFTALDSPTACSVATKRVRVMTTTSTTRTTTGTTRRCITRPICPQIRLEGCGATIGEDFPPVHHSGSEPQTGHNVRRSELCPHATRVLNELPRGQKVVRAYRELRRRAQWRKSR